MVFAAAFSFPARFPYAGSARDRDYRRPRAAQTPRPTMHGGVRNHLSTMVRGILNGREQLQHLLWWWGGATMWCRSSVGARCGSH
eukprot:SAG31_NODE_5861_length_2285_cov_1.991766_4_plen_85_part_00